MKKLYSLVAYLVCGLVAVQAGTMVWAHSGMFQWVAAGGVLDKAAIESSDSLTFDGVQGFMIHGMNGMMVIPSVAVVLLVLSFFAKVPHGVAWAIGVAVLVALQVALGLLGHEFTISGLFHGVNALVLFTVALLAGLRARG
ncbi:MAG: hypothetical protein IPO80_12375 [Propionibacteriaceae bacterium]|jgi:hypothetical protein|nr:hypothetical protein [Propionibacteriaceae bacterium]